MKRYLNVFVLGLLASSDAAAQAYEGNACDPGGGDPRLARLDPGDEIGPLSNAYTGLFQAWATSMRPPEGRPPKAAAEEDPALREAEYRHDRWTCTYSAESAQDGKTTTAWSAGHAERDGIGEAVVIHVDTTRPVRIWTGYGKSVAAFESNNRPRKVRVTVLQARGFSATEMGETYSGIKVLAQSEVELKDVNGWQPLPLPKHEIAFVKQEGFEQPLGPELTFLAVKVLSVYPGKRYHDTLISEVGNPR